MTDPKPNLGSKDPEINLKVNELLDLCAKKEVPIILSIQEPNESFTSAFCNTNSGKHQEKIGLMKLAATSWTADELIEGMIEQSRRHGHSSMYLRAMGATGFRSS